MCILTSTSIQSNKPFLPFKVVCARSSVKDHFAIYSRATKTLHGEVLQCYIHIIHVKARSDLYDYQRATKPQAPNDDIWKC